MRHFYFRLILGIVCLAAAVVSAVKANISFAALYVVLGILFHSFTIGWAALCDFENHMSPPR